MKNKINFKIFFKTLKHYFKNIGSDADKDWKIIVTVFFISFLGIIAFHINLFINIQNKLSDGEVNVAPVNKPVNSDLLNEMVIKYDKRAEEYKKIDDAKFQMIDPSR